MADNETIADIIARKRRLAAEMEKSLGDQHSSVEMLKDDAARLEAAYKRECGDVAKLREALSKSCAYSAVVLNAGMFNRVYLEALLNMAKAALAAPVRNCNMFQTKDAAREAFQKLRGHRVWADVSLWDDRDEIEAFLDWLFALGKEGGAK